MSQSPHRWDLVVVGGGTAGIVAATTAARVGATVLLVERDRTGGDCLWTGCVPSKALLSVADTAATARTAGGRGVHTGGVSVDFAAVMEHVHHAIAVIEPQDSPGALAAAGVTVRHGVARFTGPTTVDVDGETVAFRQAVLATGAAPAVPPVPGLDRVGFLTSETVWQLTQPPGRLAVLGGGTVGCELGQGLARLGAEVTLVEAADRLLPREDPAAAAAVHRALERDGVRVLTGQPVVAAEPDAEPAAAGGGTGLLRLADDTTLWFDRLLVAVGRAPRTGEIGLDAAGVERDERGFVVVDDQLRTTTPVIRAAGDLTGHPQFTHTAGVHGSLAASNAVLGVRRTVERTGTARVTFTQPEVAAVGVDTGSERDGVRVLTIPHDGLDRGVVEARTDGFTRIAVGPGGRVRGATVVGPRAGESLGELAVAVRRGLRTRDLAAVTHAYPTWNDGPWHAVLADLREQLARPRTRRVLQVAVGARRQWLDLCRGLDLRRGRRGG